MSRSGKSCETIIVAKPGNLTRKNRSCEWMKVGNPEKLPIDAYPHNRYAQLAGCLYRSLVKNLNVWLHFWSLALMLFNDWLEGGLLGLGSGISSASGRFWGLCEFFVQGLFGWLPQSLMDFPETSMSTRVLPQFPFFRHASCACWILLTTFWTICLTIWFIWFSPNREESIWQAESNPP